MILNVESVDAYFENGFKFIHYIIQTIIVKSYDDAITTELG